MIGNRPILDLTPFVKHITRTDGRSAIVESMANSSQDFRLYWTRPWKALRSRGCTNRPLIAQTLLGIFMRAFRISMLFSALIAGAAEVTVDHARGADDPSMKRSVDAAAVAISPAPGTVVPTFFQFGGDRSLICFLASGACF